MALAVGMLVAALSEPRWEVGGAPWVHGRAKNVEIRATLIAVLAGAAAPLLGRWRAGRLAVALVALIGMAVGASRWPTAILPAAMVAMSMGGLAVAIERGFLRAAPRAANGSAVVWPWLVALAAALFVRGAGPLTVDVFHHGEVLVTALDLLRGGRPFETIAWPHGAHDSGLAALWIALTGKVGSSPVVLATASMSALATLTLYALARRATDSPRAAVLGAGLTVAILFVLDLGPNPRPILGMLAFPILALALATARPPYAVAAGAAAALGLIFRIDAGTYGLVALAVALIAMALLEPAPLADRLRRAVGLGARAALGAAALLLVLRLLLGWPTTAWYAYLVGSLPRYHSIANGLPYPWPGIAPTTGRLIIGLALPALAIALGALAVYGAQRGAPRQRVALLGSVAVLAAGALRTGLGRSDSAHLMHYFQPMLFLAVLLAASAGLAWIAAHRRAAGLLLAGVALGLVVLIAGNRRSLLEQLPQHLAANPPVGDCGDTMFTPLEARRDDARGLIDATCTVERQLRDAGVRRLVIDHSAPWYYVRFGMPLPSPYYSFNRAALPDQQQAVVDDLRAYDAEALLVPRGFGGLTKYDVPDGLRVPLIGAYLHERRGDAPAITTPIGDLALWNRAGTSPAPGTAPSTGLIWQPQRTVYDPVTRFLVLSGRVKDTITAGAPALQVAGAITDLQSTFAADGSYELITRLPAGTTVPPAIEVIITAADGRTRRVPIAAAAITLLPPLSGDAARDLDARTDQAAAAGRADRAAALAR